VARADSAARNWERWGPYSGEITPKPAFSNCSTPAISGANDGSDVAYNEAKATRNGPNAWRTGWKRGAAANASEEKGPNNGESPTSEAKPPCSAAAGSGSGHTGRSAAVGVGVGVGAPGDDTVGLVTGADGGDGCAEGDGGSIEPPAPAGSFDGVAARAAEVTPPTPDVNVAAADGDGSTGGVARGTLRVTTVCLVTVRVVIVPAPTAAVTPSAATATTVTAAETFRMARGRRVG
jgi:hypothetical protein